MGDTILIETTADEVVSIVTAGPQGPSGSEAATLTTTGDLLYRAALANDRLPIGSEGQVLKVASGVPAWGDESGAVTSVNGETGAVALNAADVGAAPSTHAASHAAAGSDPLAPSDIGAQSLFETTTYDITSTGSFTLTAARAQIAIIVNYSFAAATVTLPTSGNVSGDIAVVRANPSSGTLTVAGSSQGSETIPIVGSKRYVYDGSAWQRDPVYTHTHNASDIISGTLSHAQGGLEANVSSYNGLLKIASGSTSAVTVTAAGEALLDDADAAAQRTTLGLGNSATLNTGTTAGTVAEGNHTHADLHTRSHAITSTSDHTAGNHKVFYSDGSGEIVELALGNSGEVLTSNGATSAPSFAAASGGVSAVGASAADILSVSGSDLVADDPNADRLVFWDDSAGALKYLTAGSGLTITDTTIAVAGGSTNLWIPASAWIPKTTAGCGVDSRELATNDQNFDELLFDAGTDEFADALVVMPSNYNNGTVTARFYWTAASGSGGVAFAIQGRAFANDDALDTTAGTAQLVTDTLIAADDMHVTSATSAVTIGGTPAANTPIQFTIYRDVSDAADDLAVDARLLGVEIIYTAA